MFSKKNIYIALLVIILLGAYLRFYRLGNNSFVADEFLDINSTYAYFKTGIWQNWDFNLGEVNNGNAYEARDERAWVYRLPIAKLFIILPPTEAVARSVSVLWGILTIFLIYFVATYFTRKYMIGLMSAFLFAVSIGGIEMDRRLRMYAMFLPVYLLFSWLLFRFLEDKYKGENNFLKVFNEKWGVNLLFLIPAALAGVLSLKTHQLTGNMAFVLVFYLLFWSIASYWNSRSFKNKYSIILAVILAGFIIASLIIPGEIKPFTSGLQYFNNHWEYLKIAFSDYSNGILGFIFVVLGIYFLVRKQKLPQEGSWLAISFLVPLLAAILLWSRNIGAQYIFFIKSFEIILIASGIYFSAVFLKDNFKNNGKKVYLIAIIMAILILPNYSYFLKTDDNIYNQTSESSNPNYRKIFAYFKKAKKDGDVLITRNFRNYYWSGAQVKVFDFGGEQAKEKLSLMDIQNISAAHPSGWFIVSSNDESYIANEAMEYVVKNFNRVSNPQVRGDIMVYRWGN